MEMDIEIEMLDIGYEDGRGVERGGEWKARMEIRGEEGRREEKREGGIGGEKEEWNWSLNCTEYIVKCKIQAGNVIRRKRRERKILLVDLQSN